MQFIVDRDERAEYPRAVGHALGYLTSVAVLPALALQAHGHRVAPWLLLLAVTVLLRAYMGGAVRDALSPMRSRFVLVGVDQSALFVGLASIAGVFAAEAANADPFRAWLCAGLMLVAALLSVQRLLAAHRTWHSTTFLSRVE